MAEDEFLKRLGSHIRKKRKAKGISVREFELEYDFDRAQLSRIERGESSIQLVTLKKILRALNITLKEFFSDFEE